MKYRKQERDRQNTAYLAKQVLAIKEEQGAARFGFSTPAGLEKEKNQNLRRLVLCLQQAGQRVSVVNFDPDFDGQGINQLENRIQTGDLFSYDPGERAMAESFDLVFYNLLPVLDQKARWGRNMCFDGVLVTIRYGVTSYSDYEAALGLLAENQIPVLGILANR